VGIEVPGYYLHPHHYVRLRDMLGAALVAEPTNLIHDLKLVKSPAELAYIRKAAAIADIAMDAFARELRAGRSELSIAGRIYAELLAAGSGISASPINLVSGERSGFSHGAPTERVLKNGDFGSVEYGAAYRRYTATIGRQFAIGAPTSRMVELYDVVRRACDACIAEIRDGVPATVPHEAARKVIADAGLERGRVHTSGYGLAPGFPPTWGEPLHMLDKSDYVLKAGMVVTVEPPVFLGDERLGARIIDNVLVTKTGAELLSGFSRDIVRV
jgi:Xaa-Pro dipeptidase